MTEQEPGIDTWNVERSPKELQEFIANHLGALGIAA